MRPRKSLVSLHAAAAIVGALLPACTDGAPPFNELPLRDVLSARPSVVAQVPADARREIAERLQAPPDPSAPAEQAPSSLPERSTASLVYAADARREAAGADALVLAGVRQGDSGPVLHPVTVAAPGAAPPARLLFSGASDAETGTLEQRALDTTAGAILVSMGAEPGTTKLVRVTGWPAGVVAAEGVFYVNASWLVALAGEGAEDQPRAPGAGSQQGSAAPASPPRQPLSARVNPYMLPDSVAACADDVVKSCDCAPSSCTGSPTDPSFSDENAECAWVKAVPTARSAALCALALMNIKAIASCMAESPCLEAAPANHTEAESFMADKICAGELEFCLRTGMPDPSSVAPTQPQSCNSCGDGCGCNDCERNCRLGVVAPPAANATGEGATSKGCTVAAGQPRACVRVAAPAVPAGWLWLLLPPVYVLYRTRRRA